MKRRISRTVVAAGVVSFLTDVSAEMIYPLLPAFLATEFGAGAFALGLIEGVAESTAAILKLVSGVWSDRIRKKKPFVLIGYGLSGAARPLIGLATSWPGVLAIRLLDRVGKGIRTSPRDALISDSVDESMWGRSFGLQRA
ncbi:MAG: MFS transporter, partial [Bdellovibrionota bacterium]